MALDAPLGITQNKPAPETVNWNVSLDARDLPAKATPRDQAHPIRLAAGDLPVITDVPVITNGDVRQGNYPTTLRPVNMDIVRQLLTQGPSVNTPILAGLATGEAILSSLASPEAVAQFLRTHTDRSNEVRVPASLVLFDASTNPALKDKAGWGAATDPALYATDPNLTGALEGRNLKPVRDTAALTNAKSPDSFYVIGYDKQLRPSDVLEYYSENGKMHYRDQYLLKYDSKPDGSDVVSVFKYRASDQPRGRDNSDAVGTIEIGANHRSNKLEGMTQYFRRYGQTYAMRKWDGSTMQLGKDELSATPIPSGQVDASGQPQAKFPPIEEIKFDDFQNLNGTLTRTIAQGQGNITLSRRDQQLRSHDSVLSGKDALTATFLYAKDFYFYDPFGPNIPLALKVPRPAPYSDR